MTRIGVGGLMNLQKLKEAHIVMNDICLFHHHAALQKAQSTISNLNKAEPENTLNM